LIFSQSIEESAKIRQKPYIAEPFIKRWLEMEASSITSKSLVMKLIKSIGVCSLFFLLLLSCGYGPPKEQTNAAAKKQQVRPNVIVILIDDAGYVDFGFMGSKNLPTPEIDKLAKSGAIFTDAHVSATVCAPSRAGLMAGQYQQRTGFEANGTGGMGLSDDAITLADVFKTNSYNTYALGKWHLGDDPSDHPNQRGFDEFYGFLAGSRSYFPLKKPSVNRMLQHNGEQVIFEGYMTDVLGDQAVKFATESVQEEQPFFMYLAFNAVHTPMEAKTEDLQRFEGHPRQELAAMTWSLDENVGKLRQALAGMGELDNTLIFFLSDNGGAGNNTSSGGPLKGWKGNKFEGGHRVPFTISWPGLIPENQVFDGLTSSLDIFTTATAAADLSIPKEHIVDGVNLLPFLTGEKSGDPHAALFWRKLEEGAARVGDYKWITVEAYGSVLYNLAEDIGEHNDLSSNNTSENEQLSRQYKDWEDKMKPPRWEEGESWMKVTRHIHESLMENKTPAYTDPGGLKRATLR